MPQYSERKSGEQRGRLANVGRPKGNQDSSLDELEIIEKAKLPNTEIGC